jgi:hypothetical protein
VSRNDRYLPDIDASTNEDDADANDDDDDDNIDNMDDKVVLALSDPDVNFPKLWSTAAPVPRFY